MGKRHDWEFAFTGKELRNACESMLAHHRERAMWWQQQRERAEEEVRKLGVAFRDQPVTGGNRLQAVIDPEKLNRLEECRSKLAEHESAMDQFAAFLAGFLHQPDDAAVMLTYDDIRFFGLVELDGAA